MHILDVDQFVAASKDKLESVISEEISTAENAPLLQRAIARGKRLRPIVCILAYYLSGGTDEGRILRVAASTEFAHAASLLKDEVIDRDPVRRGLPAIWADKGSVDAMWAGDTFLIAGIKGVASAGKDLLDTFLGGWTTAWSGEAREVSISQGLEKVKPPVQQAYFAVLGQKTGSLFAAAAKLGAQAAAAKESDANAFYNWAYQLGILYQLADDYVDTRKGKPEIFPFIAIMQFEEQMKNMFLDTIRKGKMTPLQALSQAGIDVEAFYKEKIEEQRIRVQSLFGALPVNIEYSGVAGNLGDWLVEQQLAELKEEVKEVSGAE